MGLAVRSEGLGEQRVDQCDGAEETLIVLAPAFITAHSLLRNCSGKISGPLIPTPFSELPEGARLAKLINERQPIV